jgi:hypothetical protein
LLPYVFILAAISRETKPAHHKTASSAIDWPATDSGMVDQQAHEASWSIGASPSSWLSRTSATDDRHARSDR